MIYNLNSPEIIKIEKFEKPVTNLHNLLNTSFT